MAQLSDTIETFIKELMCEDKQIELRRNELAQHFGCAPSQINYVLATRFSVDHGYIIESRRGGGGFVRILRMQQSSGQNMLSRLLERIGSSIDEESANAIIKQLFDAKVVTLGEGRIMSAAVAKNALALPVNAKDILRAAILKNVVTQAFRNREGDE